MGKITSSTINPPALAVSFETCREVVGEVGLPSLRRLPTNSDDSLSEPTGSTFFTGRMVSTPVPRSAGLNTVPVPSTDVRAAYDARRAERTDPEYAGGAPRKD